MSETDETLYEHAGGDEGLHRLEEIFYSKAPADPVLKQLFTKRIPTHVEHLTWFTAESFGGPDRFSRRLGFRVPDRRDLQKLPDRLRCWATSPQDN